MLRNNVGTTSDSKLLPEPLETPDLFEQNCTHQLTKCRLSIQLQTDNLDGAPSYTFLKPAECVVLEEKPRSLLLNVSYWKKKKSSLTPLSNRTDKCPHDPDAANRANRTSPMTRPRFIMRASKDNFRR